MGVTEYFTPGYGIVISFEKNKDFISKLFDFEQGDECESPSFTDLSRDGKYVALNIPHDICEELSPDDADHFVFIGVVDGKLETPFGFSARTKRNNYRDYDKKQKRLEFGEGKYIKWDLFKAKYDELEKELKARYVEIEGHEAALYFIPDDCLCCT